MGNWISVKDSLPDKGSSVLVYMADRGSVIITYYLDDFALIRCGITDGFSEHGVTHWMYLPAPPNPNPAAKQVEQVRKTLKNRMV